MRTTKGGPHGHVHRARNFISESGLPCVFHAARNRHDAIPIDNHAIYMPRSTAEERTRISILTKKDGMAQPYLVRHANEIL